MTEQQIRRRLKERLSIDTLNDMQATMADASEPLTLLVAPTGSGKTVAFLIPALKALQPPCGQVQMAVIAPSRELVLQIAEVTKALAEGYKSVALYGGHSMQDEANSLIMSPDIIVATPGRLVDHIRRGQLRPGMHLSTLVLDEYDKSLDLGFADEMRRIMRFFVAPDHIILTSATALESLPEWFPKVTPRLFNFTTATEAPRSRIHIVRVESASRDKLASLASLIAAEYRDGGKMIVFVNHRESAERVYEYLRQRRVPAGLYHGGLEQWDREKAIELLNNGTTPILVSTDLASRGLDIDSVDSVVHYHPAPTREAWTHRNGRTARQGDTGTVYLITSEGESLPEWGDYDHELPLNIVDGPLDIPARVATLYFNAGRKEKISRGDIVGFLLANSDLAPDEIGRINVRDHSALAAIPATKARSVVASVAHQKIKGKKVKVTLMNS